MPETQNTPENKPNLDEKLDKFQEVVTQKAEEVKDEMGKGFENMQRTVKDKTQDLDLNLKPVIEELHGIKAQFQEQIKTPIGTKIIVAILTGLILGVLIWLIMGILSQNFNPSVFSWIIGLILIQITDVLTGFTPRIQKILTKLLQERK